MKEGSLAATEAAAADAEDDDDEEEGNPTNCQSTLSEPASLVRTRPEKT